MKVEVTPLASGGRAWDKAENGKGCGAIPEEPAILLAELPWSQGQELTQLPSLTELHTRGCEETSAPDRLPACCLTWAPLCFEAENKETRALHCAGRPCREELDEIVQGSFRLPLLELILPSVFTTPPSALPHHLAPCYSGASP